MRQPFLTRLRLRWIQENRGAKGGAHGSAQRAAYGQRRHPAYTEPPLSTASRRRCAHALAVADRPCADAGYDTVVHAFTLGCLDAIKNGKEVEWAQRNTVYDFRCLENLSLRHRLVNAISSFSLTIR
jgi:hypothetical protein